MQRVLDRYRAAPAGVLLEPDQDGVLRLVLRWLDHHLAMAVSDAGTTNSAT